MKLAKIRFILDGTTHEVAYRVSENELELFAAGSKELELIAEVKLKHIVANTIVNNCKVTWENEVISSE